MWHHSWGCEPIAWLLPSWCRKNFMFTEVAVLRILLCFLYCPPPWFCQLLNPYISHNHAILHTSASNSIYREKKKQKQNKHIFRGQWDSLVCQYASISWSGSYWTSRVFNGFLEIQLWGHLERQYCGKLKCKPTGSLCSQENNHSMFCFTHSQKENSDLGTKGWRYWEIYIYSIYT